MGWWWSRFLEGVVWTLPLWLLVAFTVAVTLGAADWIPTAPVPPPDPLPLFNP